MWSHCNAYHTLSLICPLCRLAHGSCQGYFKALNCLTKISFIRFPVYVLCYTKGQLCYRGAGYCTGNQTLRTILTLYSYANKLPWELLGSLACGGNDYDIKLQGVEGRQGRRGKQVSITHIFVLPARYCLLLTVSFIYTN